MKTLEELKACGFHCNNMVQVEKPCFLYDWNTNIISYNITDEHWDQNFCVKSERIFPIGSEEEVERINNAQLVAWYPCRDESDYVKTIRCEELLDANGTPFVWVKVNDFTRKKILVNTEKNAIQ